MEEYIQNLLKELKDLDIKNDKQHDYNNLIQMLTSSLYLYSKGKYDDEKLINVLKQISPKLDSYGVKLNKNLFNPSKAKNY